MKEKGIYFDRSVLEADRGKFVPGAEVPVILRVADSGTKYVMAVLNPAKHVAHETPALPVATSTVGAKIVTKASETMSKADWNAKDRSMMLGGISHDAAQLAAASVTANVSIHDVVQAYCVAMTQLIKFREEVK